MSDEKSYIKPPRKLVIDSTNGGKNWKEWLQQYNWYGIATQIDKKSKEVQAATFMMVIGEEASCIFNTFGLSEEEQKDVEIIKQKFQEYFMPRENEIYERYQFNKIKQVEGQSFDEFLTIIKTQAARCNYGTLQETLIRDKIVIGVLLDSTREKLLIEPKLTLKRAIDICKLCEQTKKELNEIKEEHSSQMPTPSIINAVKSGDTTKGKHKIFLCHRCGTKHAPRKCPAYGKACTACGVMGHFAKKCRSKNKSKKEMGNKKVNEIYKETSSEEEQDLYLHEVRVSSLLNNTDWIQSIKFKNKCIKFKLDTGAQCNVLTLDLANKINAKIETSRTKNLVSYSGHKIKVKGEINIQGQINGIDAILNFKIIEENQFPILGKETCQKYNLLVRPETSMMTHSLQIDEQIFKGLGCLKDFKYDIDLVGNAKFEIIPPRKIPHSIKKDVQEELNKMVEMKVIEPTTEPTPVVSPMVIVRKNNKLRICIDPSQVNKNLLRRHFPLKTIDDITAKIRDAKYFTLLDCKKGFWQIPVTERTKKYLTFSTPWGRYSFKRLPFGLSASPEIFAQILTDLLKNVENVESSMDDILIYGKTLEQLKDTTNRVIDLLKNAGLRLNKDKCIFNSSRIRFLGHVLTDQGLEPDPEKIEAIERLQTPKNKKMLQRLLGMVTYLSKFIKNLSQITQPLRILLNKDVSWVWDHEQQEAFEEIKAQLVSPPVLKYYDVNKDVVLSVDSSSTAFGALLMQEGHPIAYGTKSLTKAQLNYPQIEKEASAIRFACKKFHEYIYGKKLVVETDHQPLQTIFKKPIQSAPPRLQRILFDLAVYSPTVIYKKGKDIPIPDALSRDCNHQSEDEEEDNLEVNVILPISNNFTKMLREEIAKDEKMQKLVKNIMHGWQENDKYVDNEIKHFTTFKEELAFYDGLLFKGHKLVIPDSLKLHVLKLIHEGHLGIQSSIKRAREVVYWKNLALEISNYVNNCTVCVRTQRSNTKESIILKKIPEYPAQIIATDLFHFQKDNYLLIVDSYSGWFEFKKLKYANSTEVIQFLKEWFSNHGICETLESDNGPQFSSKEFADFSKSWSFFHQTSSPHYPKSNGLAERFVQTAKLLLKRCAYDNTDIYAALLNLRNTPRDPQLQSSAQRMFSRSTRSKLHGCSDLLKPKIVENVPKNLEKARQTQKQYADRHSSKNSEKFKNDDTVALQTGHRQWITGRVIDDKVAPRSILVQTDDGQTYRRNSIHLKQTKVNIPRQEPAINIPPEGHEDKHYSSLEERNPIESTHQETLTATRSRSGRIIKKPDRLDL